MKCWYAVSIDGEMRVCSHDDPAEFVETSLDHLHEQFEDVEFDVEDCDAEYGDESGRPPLRLFPLSMRYAERFWSAEDAAASAAGVAMLIEKRPLPDEVGIESAKIVFQLQSVDPYNWDDPQNMAEVIQPGALSSEAAPQGRSDRSGGKEGDEDA